ncbi:MAG: hypothetical protein R2854_18865 [Caldilineaceae bacterium]
MTSSLTSAQARRAVGHGRCSTWAIRAAARCPGLLDYLESTGRLLA